MLRLEPHVSTLVMGTQGYVDPQYVVTASQLNGPDPFCQAPISRTPSNEGLSGANSNFFIIPNYNSNTLITILDGEKVCV
ncbi:hypothetical protein P8452_49604 [Trifolium repens]|nr:hypothetical protein P8452_49604 [Trifolium repens]